MQFAFVCVVCLFLLLLLLFYFLQYCVMACFLGFFFIFRLPFWVLEECEILQIAFRTLTFKLQWVKFLGFFELLR